MPKIKIKGGLKANIPILDEREPAFTTDTEEFFVGSKDGNIQLAKQTDLDVTNVQVTNNTSTLNNLVNVNPNAEVLDARGTYSTLGNRLNASDVSLATIMSQLINVKNPPNGLTPAKGDGITDDTPAINAMVQYVQTNNLGGLYFPNSSGNYMINAVGSGAYDLGGIIISSPMQIILHPNATLKAITNNQDGYRILNIRNTSNVLIQGGSVIGDLDTHTGSTGQWGNGIYIINSNRVFIKDVSISKCWGDGLTSTVDNTSNVNKDIYVTKVKSTYNRRQGFSIISGNGVYVENSEFSYTSGQAPQAGIDIECNSGYITPSNIFINNCKFVANYTGVLFGNVASNVVISKSAFSLNTHSSIEITNTTSKVKIAGNIMEMDSTQTNNGILINGAINDISISNNIIKDAVSGGGISSFYAAQYVTIENNEIYNCKDGIDFSTTSPSYFTILNNTFHDLTGYGIFPNVKLYDSMINDNNFYNITGSDGIYARLGRVQISGNTFNTIAKRGIGGSDIQECVITNNRFKQMGTANTATNPSIQFDGASSDNYIANNYFRNSDSTHVSVSTTGSTVTLANVITKNNCRYTPNGAISVNASDIALDNFIRNTPEVITYTFDPASLATGASTVSSAITYTGARLGDFVLIGAPYDLQGLNVSGYVSATDTVKIVVQNNTGATIDLASGSWRVRVLKST